MDAWTWLLGWVFDLGGADGVGEHEGRRIQRAMQYSGVVNCIGDVQMTAMRIIKIGLHVGEHSIVADGDV